MIRIYKRDVECFAQGDRLDEYTFYPAEGEDTSGMSGLVATRRYNTVLCGEFAARDGVSAEVAESVGGDMRLYLSEGGLHRSYSAWEVVCGAANWAGEYIGR